MLATDQDIVVTVSLFLHSSTYVSFTEVNVCFCIFSSVESDSMLTSCSFVPSSAESMSTSCSYVSSSAESRCSISSIDSIADGTLDFVSASLTMEFLSTLLVPNLLICWFVPGALMPTVRKAGSFLALLPGVEQYLLVP